MSHTAMNEGLMSIVAHTCEATMHNPKAFTAFFETFAYRSHTPGFPEFALSGRALVETVESVLLSIPSQPAWEWSGELAQLGHDIPTKVRAELAGRFTGALVHAGLLRQQFIRRYHSNVTRHGLPPHEFLAACVTDYALNRDQIPC